MAPEHDELADSAEREAQRLQEHSDRLGGEIDGTRQDWENKRADGGVPGAEPRDDEDEDSEGDSEPEPDPERE